MKRSLLIAASLLFAAEAFGATCKISEYANVSVDTGGREVPVAREPAVATQSVTYTTSSQSAVFNTATRFVRIVCDAKAHFVFGANPTATAASPYVGTDVAEYFGITTSGIRVAFYDGSS